MTIEDLEARFATVSAERTHHRDQHLGIVACTEALAAAKTGNYGVGAVLVDPKGEIVEQGRNHDRDRGAEDLLHSRPSTRAGSDRDWSQRLSPLSRAFFFTFVRHCR